MSVISVSTTYTTAYQVSADITGQLVVKTGSGPTEAFRIDTSGNIGINTSTPATYGMVTINSGANPVVLGMSSGNNNILSYTKTQYTALTASSTYDVFRFLNQSGTVIGNTTISGHFYIYAQTSGGNSYSAVYSVVTNGNGTSQSSLNSVSSSTRGTSPVSTVQLAADGSSGAIKLQIVTNSATGANYYAQVMFIGMVF
jgi:hypothetical protein